jgi:superfamily II DNA or RNA helicase
MPTPFSSQDLGRIFDGRALTRGRTLGLSGGVEVELEGDTISGVVQDQAFVYTVSITPSLLGRRVVLDSRCTCRVPGCAHLAAAAFGALDRFPALRRPEQQTFLDTLTAAPPEKERQRIVFELAPGDHPYACLVTTVLIGERTGVATPTTPAAIAADDRAAPAARDLAYLLGEGGEPRTGVRGSAAVDVLDALVESGLARWHAGGKRLVKGDTRVFASASALPPRSGVIVADSGPWYVDAVTGAVGRVRIQAPVLARPVVAPPVAPVVKRRVEAPSVSEQMIVDRPMVPVLRLTRFPCPDEFGRMQMLDALLLEFDYDGGVVAFDDDRQFVRVNEPGGPVFVRRDKAGEAAAADALRSDGLVQMRMATAAAAKGRLVWVFRGRDAAEAWQGFVAERLPAMQALGWRNQIDRDFGPRLVESVGTCDMRVADAPNGSSQGSFSLDFGIEIDGARHPLLPILMRLRERGGMASARVIDGEVVTSLDDGRILKLPAERVARLLAVMDDLVEAAGRSVGETMVLDGSAAPSVLDLEDLVTTRWQDGAMIIEQVARYRAVSEIPEAVVPARFTAVLRPYQQLGVNWLQHLRANGSGGLLADDMGLGKTAQTIASIVIEEDEGRLDRPVLVVVPTSLVPNWISEIARFAPHLRVAVLHGLDRHEKRRDLSGVHVVITTYTVLSRDIEEMAALAWHMVVLDEAQAIKSPTAKATHAVCRLQTRHRVCLSGTPIENNLGELWSQFAFLMPGLLGQRKSFNRRFRAPIEKDGDPVRRGQLATRIRPFILRRTKSAVATELPPKHTILRRITLAPDQRELYETIRATMHEKVVAGIAARGMAQSHVLVLQALLKLRQVCCDPRLTGVASGEASSKLDDLLEMVSEMVSEGRRILLFSQFTSMLDLMKPALTAAGVPFVELRGDTVDRAAPVARFEAGEVPLFLISLKAGGRGLNLTSADTVIHYDPWWNPAVEDQASDRAHRIGQTKSVFVYKLIAADTVEERIVELQERKAALASLALSEDGMALPAMDAEDIDYLFGVAPGRLAA